MSPYATSHTTAFKLHMTDMVLPDGILGNGADDLRFSHMLLAASSARTEASRESPASLATYPNNTNDDVKSSEMLRRSINHYKYQPYLWLEQTLYSNNRGPHMQNTYTLNPHDTYNRCVSPVFLPQHLHKCKFLRYVVLTLTR